jgi:hypothetical protein
MVASSIDESTFRLSRLQYASHSGPGDCQRDFPRPKEGYPYEY